MRERRTHRRTPASRPLEIRPLPVPTRRAPWQPVEPQSTAPKKNFGRLIDIGCGGVGAMFNDPVEVGITCELRIHGPSGKIQVARGCVRTLKPGADGNRLSIAFDDPIVALGDVKRSGPTLARDYDPRPLVLVVDDEIDVRTTLDRFLTRRGMRVLPAGDADQAIAAIEAAPPLLMLLDLRMPEVTGIQLLKRMQALDITVPHIWAMSGYVSDEDAMLAFEYGASMFLEKPFDLDHLDYSLRSLAPAPAPAQAQAQVM